MVVCCGVSRGLLKLIRAKVEIVNMWLIISFMCHVMFTCLVQELSCSTMETALAEFG